MHALLFFIKNGSTHEIQFLKSVGAHCRLLRENRKKSIQQIARESDQLSASVIHRLERGSGPVTLTSLARYAEVLELHPKELLDVPFDPSLGAQPHPVILPLNHPRVQKDAYKILLPLYSLRAAAGYFGSGEEVTAEGWMVVKSRQYDTRYFIVKIVGHSMEPRLPNGSYAIFRANPVGTRQSKIVLAQYRGTADPETGGSFTVKKYTSSKAHRSAGDLENKNIWLEPLNSEFKPITVKSDEDVRILAEFFELVE